ncbi:ATP-dependent DNA helicase Hrp3 [Sorochytrium milnesiophthora]
MSDVAARRGRIVEDAEMDPDLYGLRRSERARSKQPSATDGGRHDDGSETDTNKDHRAQSTGGRQDAGGSDRPRRRSVSEHSEQSDTSFDGSHSSSRPSSSSSAGGESSAVSSSESDDDYAERPRRKAAAPGKSKTRQQQQKSRHPPKKKPTKRNIVMSDSDEEQQSPDDDDDEEDGGEEDAWSSSRVARSSRRRDAVSYKDNWDEDEFTEADEDPQGSYAVVEEVAPEVDVIEQVMDHRVTPVTDEDGKVDDSAPPNTMYLIKWKGLSHLHNTWEPEDRLRHLRGAKKVVNYAKVAAWEEQQRDADADAEENEELDVEREMKRALLDDYKAVERVIGARQVTSSEDNPSGNEYLCKWKRLDYSQCTWEAESLIAAKHQADIDAYYAREYSTTVPHRSKAHGAHRPQYKSKQQPSYVTGGELREYQKLGVSWMLYLWSRNENGILADEMGLGKTVQTITALNILFHEFQVYGPFLVVVPLSVIHSWQSEFAKWAPEMNVIVYVGNREARSMIRDYEFHQINERSKKQHLKFNVLVTTFELILKDQAELGAIKWAFLAVDEAHRLKNSDSQLHEALKDFKTANRLLITGTPLQNSIRELNALIQFLMPDKFSDLEEFEFDYGDEHQEAKIRTLHERLKPFMLRRLKRDVEKSLPNKTERILRVDLAPLQVHYYKNILTKNFNVLNKGISGPGQLSLLNIATELKKASNHPFLFPNAETLTDNRNEQLKGIIMASGKMVLLDKLLTRLKAGGHRVLIFSQMVRVLDILTDYLNLRDYRFQRLDGSVSAEQRKKAIEHFNAENSPDFVFLLSTRAGGLGLNLTTADTVIIFDSDWNPQNDLQAMARAHRIGQTKQVNVYRFISKDTIEEDIIERAKRKMILEYCVIKQMDTSGVSVVGKEKAPRAGKAGKDALSKDDLSAILKFGAQSMFKDEANRQKLDDMDLDEILARAEEHATTQDEEVAMAVGGGDDFLSQFQVSDYGGLAQLTWDDIIPEEDRRQAEEEERKQRMDELQRQEEELLQRKIKRSMAFAGMDTSIDNGSATKEKKKAARKPPAKRSKEPSGALSERDVRALARAICKFGDIELCRDAIIADAGLGDKTVDAVASTAQHIVNLCEEAVNVVDVEKPSKAITVTYENVPINATQLATRVQDLTVLHRYLSRQNLETFRLSFPLKPVSNWNCSWTPKEDTMLIIGVYRHGFGNWMKMREDAGLELGQKMFLDEEGKDKIPRQEHLNRRAEYVMRVIREKVEPATLAKQPAKPKPAARGKTSGSGAAGERASTPTARRSRDSDSAKARSQPADDSELSDASDLSSPDASDVDRDNRKTNGGDRAQSTNGGATDKDTERDRKKSRRSKESSRHSSDRANGHRSSKSKSSSSSHKGDRNSSRHRRRDKEREHRRSREQSSAGSDASDSEIDYRRCKDIMRPCKSQLKQLKYDTPKEEDSTKKVALITQCLTAIGSELDQGLAGRVRRKGLSHRARDRLERDLWRFVSEWFPNNPGWKSVKQLYDKLSQRNGQPSAEPRRSSNGDSELAAEPTDRDSRKRDRGDGQERTKDRERDRDRDRERDKSKSKSRRSETRHRDRSRERERDHDRDRDRGHERDRDRGKEREKDRDRDRDRERDRDRPKDRGDKSKSREQSRKDRGDGAKSSRTDLDRDRQRDRDKESSGRAAEAAPSSSSSSGKGSKRGQDEHDEDIRKRRKTEGLE